jgi:hypothetical protein
MVAASYLLPIAYEMGMTSRVPIDLRLSASCNSIVARRMSDLGAMFVLIFGTNNSSAFWCFAALMLSLRANFDRDEIGICSSLGQIASVLERVQS